MTKLANMFIVLICGGAMLYLLMGAWIMNGIERIWKGTINEWRN